MKRIFLTFSIFFIFFLMLAYPSITKVAAHNGLQLWIFTVMPALLPYTIISSILLALNAFRYPCRLFEKIFHKKLPEYEIFTAICGILCGCPIGAKIAADSYKCGHLSKSTAEFLMCAFNNISPSFIVNYIFCAVYAPYINLSLADKCILFLLLMVASVGGAVIAQLMAKGSLVWKSNHYSKLHTSDYIEIKNSPCAESSIPVVGNSSPLSAFQIFDSCILSSFEIQVKIGGYIILFTIINSLFQQTLNLSWMQGSVFGSIMELTSGLGMFCDSGASTGLYYIINNGDNYAPNIIISTIWSLTAFGGLCTMMQVKTVTSGTDLSIGKYVVSKILAGLVAFVLTYCLFML